MENRVVTLSPRRNADCLYQRTNASMTVAEALAVLQAAALRTDHARTIRRALLGLLAALESEE